MEGVLLWQREHENVWTLPFNAVSDMKYGGLGHL